MPLSLKWGEMAFDVNKLKRFVLMIDGENIHSKVLQDPQVLNTLLDNNVVVIKGPASGSGTCGNPANMGNLLISQKTEVKAHASKLGKEDPYMISGIKDSIKKSYRNVISTFPSPSFPISTSTPKQLSVDKKESIAIAIIPSETSRRKKRFREEEREEGTRQEGKTGQEGRGQEVIATK